jgi:hypothetical protein
MIHRGTGFQPVLSEILAMRCATIIKSLSNPVCTG